MAKEPQLRRGAPDVDRRHSQTRDRRATTRKNAQDRRATFGRRLDAVPDTLDFRDRMYEPTLIEVPAELPLEQYLGWNVPVLDQGQEGACTGYGLATVANFLLRQKKIARDDETVSPQMLFDLARRYDEWPGTDYDWSSARGAMKAWHKHGVCAMGFWKKGESPALGEDLARDAATRPLGAYLRVNHRDLVAMHAALAEVGILYASATVHAGWDEPDADGTIVRSSVTTGGHAFAIVGYDSKGFWIQNSWGEDWGLQGFGHLDYEDWLANGNDVWVARLGVPVQLRVGVPHDGATVSAVGASSAADFAELRPFIISTGNDGKLLTRGQFGTSQADVEEIINGDFARALNAGKVSRLLFFAHGGLISEAAAVDKVRQLHKRFLDHGIYPIFFAWHTDLISTLKNILEDAISRKRPSEGIAGVKDFLLDRVDDFLEPLARALTGYAQWSEMKENAERSSKLPDGGARITASILKRFITEKGPVEVHLAAHSAGAIFAGALAQLLATNGTIASGPLRGKTGLGLPVTSTTLFAPACTFRFFGDVYRPLIAANRIGRFSVFTLRDRFEQDDDCAGIYNKSLLYLVSNAFEERFRVPLIHPHGEPLLGMERFVRKALSDDPTLSAIFTPNDWILSPNDAPAGSPNASTAAKHGGFGENPEAVGALIARMTSATQVTSEAARPRPTPEMLRAVRLRLNEA